MPTRHSGILVQSTHGNQGNFEVVTPRVGGGLSHFFRHNDDPALTWYGPSLAFGSASDVEAVSLLQSTLGPLGNLEAITREGGHLVHRARDDGGSWRWQAATTLPGTSTVTGAPGFVQSSHGATGNFEVVAPVTGGGFALWWRHNDTAPPVWHGPFPVDGPPLDAVALMQSNFGALGNLELVARQGAQLVWYWRDDGGTWQWHGPYPLPSGGMTGAPALVQSTFGTKGHFHVVVAAAGGGLVHWWRDNDAPTLAWHGPEPFGAGTVRAVGLIHSTYGNLEVVALLDDHLEHFFRGPQGPWHGPFPFGAVPSVPPVAGGAWSIPYGSGVVAIHAALLHTGQVLVFGFADHDTEQGVSRVIDPETGDLETPVASPNLFCSGHAFLPDGRLLVAGGHHHDVASVHVFDPTPRVWTKVGTMAEGRWYPTCTALPDGRVFIISGTGGVGGPAEPLNNTYQWFDPDQGLGPATSVPTPFSSHQQGPRNVELYPFVHVLPASGDALVHSRVTSRVYGPVSDSWDPAQLVTNWPHSRNYPIAGTSVQLPLVPETDPPYRSYIMVIGGGDADPEAADPTTLATKSVEVLDMEGQGGPAWKAVAALQQARVMPDAVLLPDGTVVVVGGSSRGRADLAADPVLHVERFDPFVGGQLDPLGGAWRAMAPMHVPRLYHAAALLLPDGSVMVAGKCKPFNPPPYDYPEHRVEIFRPPYFFAGPRPTLSAPATIGYGASFAVDTPQAADISSVVLIRPGSVTHSFNMEQRLVGLSILSRSGTSVTVDAPPRAAIAPPGHYLLFVLNAARVPSTGVFVQLS